MNLSIIEPPKLVTTILEIFAIDLRSMHDADHLWRRRKSQGVAVSTTPEHLPPGRASVMGYWLTEGSPSIQTVSAASTPYHIRVSSTIESLQEPTSLGVEGSVGVGRATLSANLKGPHGELRVTIGESSAVVVASAATWLALSEPTLLAIFQCWRFHATDATLDRLTSDARGDLKHASMAALSSFRQRSRLLSNTDCIRDLLLDLPHFAGPLTDPHAFLSTENQVDAYETLANKLHLEQWSESIDERAEGVEDTYASVTEKLNEFRNFLGASGLEILIIAILLVDLAINMLGYLKYE